jgi:acyl carrier protein
MNLNPQLQTIVANHFSMKAIEITLDSTKDTIEDWDSLEHIRLILEIEATFRIKFPLEVIPQITSLKSIQIELEKLLNE